MSLRMTEEEYREFVEKGGSARLTPFNNPSNSDIKQTKYKNRRVERDGKKFDSIREANVYDQLVMMRAAGEIRLILRQVPFDLPGGIRYFADFCIIDKEGKFRVLDAKGVKTRVYINKKKQLKAIWGIDVEEI